MAAEGAGFGAILGPAGQAFSIFLGGGFHTSYRGGRQFTAQQQQKGEKALAQAKSEATRLGLPASIQPQAEYTTPHGRKSEWSGFRRIVWKTPGGSFESPEIAQHYEATRLATESYLRSAGAREPVGPVPVPPQPPNYPWLRPGPTSWAPSQPGVYASQQPGTPQPRTGTTVDWDRAFELRDLLILLRSLFEQPQQSSSYPRPPKPPRLPRAPQVPVAQSPPFRPTKGGSDVGSMIPNFFAGSYMPGASGAGLGGWADVLNTALGGGLQLASQLVGQRPSQLPIPGPLGGITLPGYVPEGSVQVPGLFQTRERAVAQPFEVMNPVTGRLVYYAPRGRPVLFSGDYAACRRVRHVAGAAAKHCGGARRRRFR